MRAVLLSLLLTSCSQGPQEGYSWGKDLAGQVKALRDDLSSLETRLSSTDHQLMRLDSCLEDKMLFARDELGIRLGILTCLSAARQAR